MSELMDALSFEPLTLVSYLDRAAAAHGDRIGVVDGRHRWTSHHLTTPIRHPSQPPRQTGSGESAARFELRHVFPSKGESRRLRGPIFGQIYRNRGFFLVTAAAYALVAMTIPADRIFDPAGGLQTVAAALPVTLAGLVVFAGLYAFTASAQLSRRRKRVVAALHTVLHVAVVVGVVDLLLQLSGVAAADPWMRAVLGGVVGALLGPFVVAVYLWIADPGRVNGDELYAGCANEAYKNFLRLHIDHAGLTIYPIGLRVPTGWMFDSNALAEAPEIGRRVATGLVGRGSARRMSSRPSSSRSPSTCPRGADRPEYAGGRSGPGPGSRSG